MTHLQLTPEDPPGDLEDVPEDVDAGRPDMKAPGSDDDPDRLHLAEAERLERYEVERAADEGMTEPSAPSESPPAPDSLASPAFEEDA